MTSGRGGRYKPLTAMHGHFQPAYLFHCLQITLGAVLSTTAVPGTASKHLRLHMTRVCDAFPSNMRSALKSQLEKGVVPARRTMDRGKLLLDTAFMIFMKGIMAQAVRDRDLFIFLADTSPIHGRHWLMCEWFRVKGHLLEQAGLAVIRMREIADEVKALKAQDQQARPEHIDDSLFLAGMVREAIDRHVMVPTCHGQAKSKLAHKLYDFFHSLRCDCEDWQTVGEIVKNLAFQTATEGGTEKRF